MTLRRSRRIHGRVFFLIYSVALLLLAGCAAPGVEMPNSTPAQVALKLADGRAARLHSGSHQAYWLWHDEDGVWHLRATSAGVRHHFEGRIRPLPGAVLADLKVTRFERNNFCEMVGRDIVFNFSTKEHEDGCDFRVNGSASLEFDLEIDHDGDPGHIFIGSQQTRPDKAHFILGP